MGVFARFHTVFRGREDVLARRFGKLKAGRAGTGSRVTQTGYRMLSRKSSLASRKLRKVSR